MSGSISGLSTKCTELELIVGEFGDLGFILRVRKQKTKLRELRKIKIDREKSTVS